MKLTPKEKELYFFIKERLNNIGWLPPLSDMARHLGVSRQRVYSIADRVVIKGYLVATQDPGRRYLPTDKVVS